MSCSEFRSMSGVAFNEMRLSKNYRSSERIVKYFSGFEVYEGAIEAVSRGKGYKSVVSFNMRLAGMAWRMSWSGLLILTLKSRVFRLTRFVFLAPQWGAAGKYDAPFGFKKDLKQ